MVTHLKEKVLDLITAQPRLVTFWQRLAVTFVVGTTIIMVDLNNFSQNLDNGGHAGKR
jgi:hypothetical protein